MPIILICDVCGEPGVEDRDGFVLCEYHKVEADLRDLRSAYKDERERIKTIYFSKLVAVRKEIMRLEELLPTLKNKDNVSH